MADIQQDGRTNKYGPATKDTEGLTAAMIHASELSREDQERSDRILGALTNALKERGMLFSKDRRYAIFRNGVLELRKSRKPDGYALDVAKSCGELHLSRQSLLALFELIEKECYDREDYPGREEWSSPDPLR